MESVKEFVVKLYQSLVITWHDFIYAMEGYPAYDRA